jgi:5-keto 4-deoxyuronate isomerase
MYRDVVPNLGVHIGGATSAGTYGWCMVVKNILVESMAAIKSTEDRMPV